MRAIIVGLLVLASAGCSTIKKEDRYRLETMGPKIERYRPTVKEQKVDEKTRNITIQLHLFENMTVKAI